MMTTRDRVVYVYSDRRADRMIFWESVGEAVGLLIGHGFRLLVAGGRAVVAAMRGDA